MHVDVTSSPCGNDKAEVTLDIIQYHGPLRASDFKW